MAHIPDSARRLEDAAEHLVGSLAAQVPETIREPLRTPLARRLGRWLWRLALLAWFAFALLVLVLRYWVMPEIASYRPRVEHELSQALQRPVAIGALDAYWVGLRPALRLRQLTINDAANTPALRLDQVEAHLAWDSFLLGELRLAHLEIAAPTLALRRDAQGRLFFAGLDITPQQDGDNAIADWLLAQDRIVVRQAQLRWHDEARAAPPIEVPGVDFRLDNDGREHRFGLTAPTLAPLAARIDLRGELNGRDIAHWRDWSGEFYLALDGANIAAGRPWFDLPPQLDAGRGDLRLWLDVAELKLRKLTADMRLHDLHGRLRADLEPLALRDLSGRISIENHHWLSAASSTGLALTTQDGLHLAPTDGSLRIDHFGDGEQRGDASANTLDLGVLAALSRHLPLPTEFADSLRRYAPQGRIEDLRLDWSTRERALHRWQVGLRFDNLSLQALGPLPGVHQLSGSVLGDQDSGRCTLAANEASLSLPTIFPDPTLALGKLDGVLEWNRARGNSAGPTLTLRRLSFANADASGNVSGLWRPVAGRPAGYIDLKASLGRAQGRAVWRYLPLAVGADARDWLRSAIVDGQASDTTLNLRGELDDFPFRDPAKGLFEVKSRIHGARLEYAPGWPSIENIEGSLLFRGPGMSIDVASATTLGTRLSKVRAEIADLAALPTPLSISGQAHGPSSEFLRFLELSPVGAMLDHATRCMRSEGSGQLDLNLFLPLETMDKARVAGRYRFDDNTLTLDPALPPIRHLSGELEFTDSSLSASTLRGTLLGGPMTVRIKTEGGQFLVSTGGEIKAEALGDVPWLAGTRLPDYLSGSSKWSGSLRFSERGPEMSFTSNLAGLASTLPLPLAKQAGEALPLRYERKPQAPRAPGARAASNAQPDELNELTVGKLLNAQWLRRSELDSAGVPTLRLQRGAFALGRPLPRLPERELLLAVELAQLDPGVWSRLFGAAEANAVPPAPTLASLPAPPAASEIWPPLTLDLHTDKLLLEARDFGELRATARRSTDSSGNSLTRIDLRGSNIAGTLDYRDAGNGRLIGTLSQLNIPAAEGAHPGESPPPELRQKLPNFDFSIERLSWQQRDLGRLGLQATNRAGQWDARVTLKNADAEFESTLRWQPDAGGSNGGVTEGDFRLDARNLERSFERAGYAGMLKRGKAKAKGKLGWSGSPTGIDFPTLAGNFEIEASDGQFNQLEPGVGRLLGVLSLQSLPRRITLDFRDVFSQGFAFDKIAGSFAVRQGVMRTDNLEVRGPAAKVKMRGQIDLGRETQDLTVRVQPALGESIAVGTMLANPVVGAAVWATQKLLSDPLDQVFAYNYAVSGSWSEPKVEKLGTSAPPAPATAPTPAATEGASPSAPDSTGATP